MKLPKYVTRNSAKGHTYYRFRRGTVRRNLPDPHDNLLAFQRAYTEALEEYEESKAPKGIRQGSVQWWCEEYEKTHAFQKLASNTKRNYDIRIRQLCAYRGNALLSHLKQKHVWAIIQDAGIPDAQADGMVKMLSILCALAVQQDHLASNPCQGVKLRNVYKGGHIAWPDDQVDQFHLCYEPGTIQRTAFDLILYLGLAVSDAVRVRWSDITPEGVHIVRGKTGESGLIPIHPELSATLFAAQRRGETVLALSSGQPRSSKGLSTTLLKASKEAKITKGLNRHGLRTTAATRLIDAGCTAEEAAAITLHKDVGMLRHYARARDQRKLSKRAMEKMLDSRPEKP